MTVVVALKPRAEMAPVSESVAQRRVRLGSRALDWLFTGLLGLTLAVLVAALLVMVFYKGELVRMGPDNTYLGGGPANSIAFSSLPLVHRLVYCVVAVVRATPIIMLFWSLRTLFRLYAAGKIFEPENGRSFSHIGGWLCAYAASPLACFLVLSATGYVIDRNWAHLASLQALVLGLLVLVIGQVMRVGREIEDDRKAFV